MKARDVVIGLIILVLLVTASIVYKKNKANKLQELSVTTPSIEQRISDTFNGLEISEDTEKTELKDVLGGDGFGIATRTEVLADLPEPEGYYQVFVDGKLMGKMRVAKGGWLFEGQIDGQKVEVKLGEKTILEGSF